MQLRSLTALTLLLAPLTTLRAEPAAPLVNPVGGSGQQAPAGDSLDQVLQELDTTGKNLKEFSARVKLVEIDNALGNETDRVGSVQFQKTPDGSARIHVIFDMRIDPQTRKGFPKDKVEYFLDGQWLIDRNYLTKTEVKRQVLKPGQKMDLFKLGEGPFPLPIGQTPEDVRKAFDIKQIPPAKDDPADTIHLQLIPKANTELARKFNSLDVWVNQKSHMPVRVDTTQKQTTRSTELKDIVVNPPGGLPASDFQLPNIDNDNWNRHVESLND